MRAMNPNVSPFPSPPDTPLASFWNEDFNLPKLPPVLNKFTHVSETAQPLTPVRSLVRYVNHSPTRPLKQIKNFDIVVSKPPSLRIATQSAKWTRKLKLSAKKPVMPYMTLGSEPPLPKFFTISSQSCLLPKYFASRHILWKTQLSYAEPHLTIIYRSQKVINFLYPSKTNIILKTNSIQTDMR